MTPRTRHSYSSKTSTDDRHKPPKRRQVSSSQQNITEYKELSILGRLHHTADYADCPSTRVPATTLPTDHISELINRSTSDVHSPTKWSTFVNTPVSMTPVPITWVPITLVPTATYNDW